jgi:DNA-directed RNA polymerase alpha subunit
VYSIRYFSQKLEFIAMHLVENAMKQIHSSSKNDLEKMNNYELFEMANQSERFRKVMLKFISSLEVKSPPFIFDVEGKYDVRKLGLQIRLKNVLLQNDIQYLSDLTYVRSKDLFKMKNFGKKSYQELLSVLDAYGFQLADGKE